MPRRAVLPLAAAVHAACAHAAPPGLTRAQPNDLGSEAGPQPESATVLGDGSPDACPADSTHLPAPGGRCEPPFLDVARRIAFRRVDPDCHGLPMRSETEKTQVFIVARERSAGVVTKADAFIRGDVESVYTIEERAAELVVEDEGGRDLSADRAEEARKIRLLAAPIVGWPGVDFATRRPTKGEDVPGLGSAIQKILDVRLHDAPPDVSVTARFQRVAREAWGDALVFDVDVRAVMPRVGAFFKGSSRARLRGALVLRASDGAISALRVHGPLEDTEVLWREPLPSSGLGAAPRICQEGEMSVDLVWDCRPCLIE